MDTIINQLDVKNRILYNSDEGYHIFVDKPTNLGEYPKIDMSLVDTKYFDVYDNDSITQYLNEILKNEDRIQIINGIKLPCNFLGNSYYCDYCNTEIKGDYFYCYHCHKDMCNLCYLEVNEEVALKNGAKNYHKRENKLNTCRNQNMLEKRQIIKRRGPLVKSSYFHTCDLCNNDCITDFYYDDDNNFDICNECYTNDYNNAKEQVNQRSALLKTKNMCLVKKDDKISYVFEQCNFGSMLYWFPILYEKELGCFVLINLNKDDKNYRKICLVSCDDHGRLGYYIVNKILEDINEVQAKQTDTNNEDNEDYELNWVLQKLKVITDRGTVDFTDFKKNEKGEYVEVIVPVPLCSTAHSSPVHALMDSLGMPVYYG